ncbi:MAG: AI-2E family transporter [Candidatus Woesearchaeota archaeon]
MFCIKQYERYVIGIALIIIAVLILFVIFPYLTAIITAGLLAYILYPLYSKLNAKIKRPNTSALIISISMVFIALLPFLAFIQITTDETLAAYNIARERLGNSTLESYCETSTTVVCMFSDVLTMVEAEESIQRFVKNSYESMSNYLLKIGSNFIVAIPSFVLNIFIVIFITYYLLKDGKNLIHKLFEIIPIRKKYKTMIKGRFSSVMRGVLFGQIYVALIQGGLAAIGYFIFGINAAIFWGLVTALFALVPLVGTAIVWVPASLSLILKGILESSGELWNGIGLFLYCALIVSTIDNFLRPKLISAESKTHPVVVLLGVLGGIKTFGIIGILIGPLILSMGYEMIKIAIEVMSNESKSKANGH